MAPKPYPPGHRAISGEPARVDFFVSSGNLVRLFSGLALLGFTVWGFRVSADVGNSVGDLGFPGTKHDLAVSVGVLTWMTIFGPFAVLGAVLVRSAFRSGDGIRLAPLELFSFLVASRALAEKYGRISAHPNPHTAPSLPKRQNQLGAASPTAPESDDPSDAPSRR